MGGEEPEEMADGISEEQVAGLLGLGSADVRALFQRADLLESAGNPVRISGELHGRGIGQKLTLPAHRGLDEVAEEDADISQHVQGQAEERPEIDASLLAIATFFVLVRIRR